MFNLNPSKAPIMLRKNIFAGCSPRLHTSQSDDDYIYYCSSSNIIVSDSTEIKNVIFLDDNLNFIRIDNNSFISGDTKGTIYVVKDETIDKYIINQSVQYGIILDKNTLLCTSLNEIYILDRKENKTIHYFKSKELLTSCTRHENLIYIGTSEGNVLIFDKCLTLISTISSHNDRIQGMDITYIGDVVYLATCSKDCTIKIWKIVKNSLEFIQTLNGHSDWVSSVYWTKNGVLVSSSFDKSVIVWIKDSNHTWSNSKMFGGSKPFYNAFIYKEIIYGQSLSGGFYKFDIDECDFISGHTDEITSLSWLDSFIMTTSLDKTTRIFLKNRETIRAQNHGYPIMVAKFLNNDDLTIVSGSQETIIRVLQPTYMSYMTINSNRTLSDYLTTENLRYGRKDGVLGTFKGLETYKIAAVLAELSLTNDVIEDFEFEGLNEYLLSTTAYSEIKKLYGHYFDIVDLDVSEDYIVSVNKALTKKFSGLFLWNKKYEIVQYLEVHNSTINRVRFSPNGRFICTASKDKSSALLEVTDKMILKKNNYDHTRVVWDCAFSHDNMFYSTCSRDNKIIIYDIQSNRKHTEFIFDHEVTTIDFNPTKYELIAGLESGDIVKVIHVEGAFKVDTSFMIKSNSKRINIARFNKDGRYLAVGGSDWLLTIFESDK